MTLSVFNELLATINDDDKLNKEATELFNCWDGVSELYAAEHLDKYTPDDVIDILHALNVPMVCGAGDGGRFYILPRLL